MPTTITQNNNEVEITLDKPIITVTDNNKGTSVNVTQTNTSVVSIATPGPKGDTPTGDVSFGHITSSGNISSSGNVYADSYFVNNVSSLDNSGTQLRLGYNDTHTKIILGRATSTTQVNITGNITASGNISASGQFIGANFGLDSTDKLQFSDGTLQFRLNDGSRITHTSTIFRPTSDEGVSLGRTAEKWKELVVNHITASGNISSSGDVLSNQIGTNKIEPALLGVANPYTLEIKSNDLYHNGSSLRTNGHITASGHISASGNLIASSSNINETTAANNYAYLVQDTDGTVKGDEKVKVLKVTGARMKTIGSSPLTVFAAPGANKAIQIISITYFLDYSAPAANFPSLVVGTIQKHALSFYCIPVDGVVGSQNRVVPMGQLPRQMITANADTVVVRDVPSAIARLGINKPVFLRYRKVSISNDNSAGDSSTTPGSDFYFKIKYRVIDVSTDFNAVTTDGTMTP